MCFAVFLELGWVFVDFCMCSGLNSFKRNYDLCHGCIGKIRSYKRVYVLEKERKHFAGLLKKKFAVVDVMACYIDGT